MGEGRKKAAAQKAKLKVQVKRRPQEIIRRPRAKVAAARPTRLQSRTTRTVGGLQMQSARRVPASAARAAQARRLVSRRTARRDIREAAARRAAEG